MSDTPISYRGSGCFGERATLARALCQTLAERGHVLAIGMGIYELAVDAMIRAQADYVDEETERARSALPPLNHPDS